MVNQDEIQQRFVALLSALTNSGKVEWVRSKSDPGFVYVLAREELIVFEVRGNGKSQFVDPTESVTGVVSKCRNVSYIWLEPTPGISELLGLLQRAPINDKKFNEFRQQAHLAPIRALESLIE